MAVSNAADEAAGTAGADAAEAAGAGAAGVADGAAGAAYADGKADASVGRLPFLEMLRFDSLPRFDARWMCEWRCRT